MSDVHVHIRRLVVDAGAEGLDLRTLPQAIEAALSARLDPRGTHQESRIPSTSDAIAAAIGNGVDLRPHLPQSGGRRG